MEEVGGPKFMGEEEQFKGNSMRWACIYVYAVGKVAQLEGKVDGEGHMVETMSQIWISLMANIEVAFENELASSA